MLRTCILSECIHLQQQETDVAMGVAVSGSTECVMRWVDVFFLRWMELLLHLFAEQSLVIVISQHSMDYKENYQRAFLCFLLWKVCFLSIKVTGGMVSKGLTPDQLGAVVSLFIFSLKTSDLVVGSKTFQLLAGSSFLCAF